MALADDALSHGYTVIVDATFLDRSRRDSFRALADDRGLPGLILDVTAPPDLLMRRVEERAAAGNDPSDAGVRVLKAQLERPHGLDADELPVAIVVDTSQPVDADALAAGIRGRIGDGNGNRAP